MKIEIEVAAPSYEDIVQAVADMVYDREKMDIQKLGLT